MSSVELTCNRPCGVYPCLHSHGRFENPADLSIDSSSEGTRRLDAPNCSAHVASYVQCPNFEAHGPVGGYITFEASMDASKKSFWGAKAPVNITSSWAAFTIEFLLKPGPRFLRGGASWLFTSIGSPGQPAVRPELSRVPFSQTCSDTHNCAM